MASVEISSLLVLNSHNSYVSHNFYVVSPLPFWKYSDIVMVRIRRIIQRTVESFPEGSVLLLPQRLSRQQAACRSLNSHQPILWAPPLDDPLPWDQLSCQTPGSTSQAPLQWHPQTSPESYSSGLNGPIHTQPGEPTALHPGPLRKAWTPSTGVFSAWF